jgi:tetratricopeptide (TPR) repeat protein
MLLRQALALLEQRDFDAAASFSRAMLEREPGNVGAKTVLGLALGALEQPEDAARWLDEVARAHPDSPHPSHGLTGLLLSLDRRDAIVPQYEACLKLAGHDASIRLALAEHLRPDCQPARIVELLRPVLEADPDCLAALILTGNSLADLADFPGAEAAFRRAVWVAPEEAAGWTNLAMMLKIEGKFDAALEAADRAVALRPGDAQIRLNRGILKLRAGRLAEAWDDYDARLELPGRGPLPPERLLRRLDELPPGGATLLVIHEDGFGDTLQYIRYAPLLAARGVRVLAWVPPELTPLLARMPGIAGVIDTHAPMPAYDLHCHISDLPRLFASTLDTIPAAPYLAPDPALVATWADLLPPRSGRLRVGLVWAGQARPWMQDFRVLDSRRSMTLDTLAPLAAVADAQFVNLQKGPAAAQLAAPPAGLVLHDPMPLATDFHQTAAIVANLDVVVAVDTAVAHLAGALGCPVLLLDRYDSCWRWFAGRDDSPWYPSLRILRQTTPCDWAPVIARAAAALTERAAALPLHAAG